MDSRNIEMFAQNYPKKTVAQGPPVMRTRLDDVMGREGFMGKQATYKETVSGSGGVGAKKFLAVVIITLLGALIFSTFFYTLTDSFFTKAGMEFFTESGQPTPAIIGIHSVVFFVLVFVVINVIKW